MQFRLWRAAAFVSSPSPIHLLWMNSKLSTNRVLVAVTGIKCSHLNLLSCLLCRGCGFRAKSDVVMRSLWLAQCSKDRRVKSLVASWSNSRIFTARGLIVDTVVIVHNRCPVTATITASSDAVNNRVVAIIINDRLHLSAATDSTREDAVYVRIVP